MAKDKPPDAAPAVKQCHTCRWWEPHGNRDVAQRGCCHVAPAQLVYVALDHDGNQTVTWGVPTTERAWRCQKWEKAE